MSWTGCAKVDCFGEMKRFPDSTFLRTTTAVWGGKPMPP